MDFEDTPQEAAFRKEVRQWLSNNVPLRSETSTRARSAHGLDVELKESKVWQGKKADAGYAFIQWPTEYGGRASSMQAVIYSQEEADFATPPSNYFETTAAIGPTIMTYASDEIKERLVPKMLRGEEVWCQLFSEPSGGSDLANVRTRAEKDGDDWIVNGQKVWTSYAQQADWAVLVARHDPTIPKHMGLTYFLVDMTTPGIEVVPIKQMSGGSGFNEVFLTDMRVPDAYRLGEVGDGWSVALTMLMNERVAVGHASRPDADEYLELAQELEIDGRPAIENHAVREQVADFYVRSKGIKNIQFRTLTALSKGETPGPEASIAKYVSANKHQLITSLGMDLQEMAGIITDPTEAGDNVVYQNGYMGSPGGRIAGGTDEIMLNIIAERVLSLPQDIRVDKGVAFNEIPSGNA
jgi:alkylation response protein AidB-like acyl-CoA dehydrogenase